VVVDGPHLLGKAMREALSPKTKGKPAGGGGARPEAARVPAGKAAARAKPAPVAAKAAPAKKAAKRER
jgi:succinyl-CoA synthetase alpha subunit